MDAVVEILKGLDYSPLYVSLGTGIVATIFSFFLGLFAARKVIRGRTKGESNCRWDPDTADGTAADGSRSLLLLLSTEDVRLVSCCYEQFGIKVVQTWAGCIIATVIAFPLMYRNARAAIEQIDVNLIHAAKTLGMPEYKIFWKVAVHPQDRDW